MRQEAQNWLMQAEAELDSARGAIGYGSYYLAAFCAHQAVEKALKAYHIERERCLPPRRHNLLELAQPLNPPDHVTTLLRQINPHYAVARYPDAANAVPALLYDEGMARTLVTAAEEVMKWLKSL